MRPREVANGEYISTQGPGQGHPRNLSAARSQLAKASAGQLA